MAESKISVYSLPELKNTTDDALPNYLNSLGFTQSHTLTDVRLALGYAAVSIAGALFYADWKLGWDVTRAYTLPAVLAYGVLNLAFTYWLLRVEKGIVYTATRKGSTLSLSTSTDSQGDNGPRYVVKAKISGSGGKEKEISVSAPFAKWFSADGYFVAKPFQRFLARGISVVGEADPKNTVEEVEGAEEEKSVPQGQQNYNVNIGDLDQVLQHIQGGSAKRRKA
ncbi:hypothetical protein BT63DRAFT_14925 [Microthyrium microscopicum]|uniref:Signal peptidase complex subunit 2 n=1 Tax=Microthyrium microscopicum TaxID=703497 RepID=A0A6A6UQQ1_9PEZI|nr:hypothetical protein BT63DRAFT_14925 [Microthyrium microscopicum]